MNKPDILLSIRPKHVENIILGRKTYELRRKIWTAKPERVYIYSTSPAQEIIGFFEPSLVISGKPKTIWKLVGRETCVTQEEFNEYFQPRNQSNEEFGFAIQIDNLVLFNESITLDMLRQAKPDITPPQSYNCIYPKGTPTLYNYLRNYNH